MTLPIFYTEPENMDMDYRRVLISGEDAFRLSHVLRVQTGDRILSGNGKGIVLEAQVDEIKGNVVYCAIESVRKVEAERPFITLFQAVSEMRRMDEAVRMAAEAGVGKLVPFLSERGEIRKIEQIKSRLKRWQKIALESSKVARRAWILEVTEPLSMLNSALSCNHGGISILFWENEKAVSLSEVLTDSIPEKLDIIIGPVGGFSEREVETFMEMGCVKAGLGGLIIRTETAGSYASMLVRYHYGLLSRGAY